MNLSRRRFFTLATPAIVMPQALMKVSTLVVGETEKLFTGQGFIQITGIDQYGQPLDEVIRIALDANREKFLQAAMRSNTLLEYIASDAIARANKPTRIVVGTRVFSTWKRLAE